MLKNLMFLAVLLMWPVGESFGDNLKGSVRIDGSSTVFPISAAVAEEFNREHKNVKVTVAYSGTGGGFKKWCLGETDINDASRPIKDKEQKCAKEHNITYLEIPVAYDGITVVVSEKNTFLTGITTAELKKLWEPESKITKWNEIRTSWPEEEIKLYGPGADSGTFDYFTEEIMGKSRASRSDYVASEDDNVLVKGVSASPFAMGYFGYAYYVENKNALKAVAIDKGKGNVTPSDKTIEDGSYALSRPIFIYISSVAVARPEIQEFVNFYLNNAPSLSHQVGYTALPKKVYEKAKKDFATFAKNNSKKKAAE